MGCGEIFDDKPDSYLTNMAQDVEKSGDWTGYRS